MNRVASLMSFESDAACCCPVRICAEGGRSGWISAARREGEIPGRDATKIESNWPRLSSSACAVATSKMAIVAPPSELTLPNRAIPLIVNLRVGPWAATPIRSPTRKPCASAVPLSITSSAGPLAHRPSVSFIGLKRAACASNPKAKLGAPPMLIVLPWRSRSFARSASLCRAKIAPAAVSTPGTRRTRGRSDAGTVALPLFERSTTWRPEMIALVLR